MCMYSGAHVLTINKFIKNSTIVVTSVNHTGLCFAVFSLTILPEENKMAISQLKLFISHVLKFPTKQSAIGILRSGESALRGDNVNIRCVTDDIAVRCVRRSGLFFTRMFAQARKHLECSVTNRNNACLVLSHAVCRKVCPTVFIPECPSTTVWLNAKRFCSI